MVRLDTNLIYERVVKVLANFPEVAGAYLYGSALEGCRPDSDIDIGLVLHEEKSNEQINKELESVVAASFEPLDGHPFDIVVLDLANPIFCFRVIRDGQLIYSKKILNGLLILWSRLAGGIMMYTQDTGKPWKILLQR